jgi:hypothetical protein
VIRATTLQEVISRSVAPIYLGGKQRDIGAVSQGWEIKFIGASRNSLKSDYPKNCSTTTRIHLGHSWKDYAKLMGVLRVIKPHEA